MEFPFTSHSTQNFPIENKYLVAPFWSDVNTNRGGSIRYQVYFSGSSLHATIEENFNFNAQWMLVVEWDRVPEYGTSNTQVSSELIHIYKCKNIFTEMLKDVGMEVPKSIETRSKCSMHADKGRG